MSPRPGSTRIFHFLEPTGWNEARRPPLGDHAYFATIGDDPISHYKFKNGGGTSNLELVKIHIGSGSYSKDGTCKCSEGLAAVVTQLS